MLVCQMAVMATARVTNPVAVEVLDLSNVYNQDVNEPRFEDPVEYHLVHDTDYGDDDLAAESQFGDISPVDDMEVAEFRGYGGYRGRSRLRYRGRR